MKIVAMIPAYNPTEQLIDLVRDLSNSDFYSIIVVNDGSCNDCRKIFLDVEAKAISKVTILHHAINLGKGAVMRRIYN